MFDTKTFNAFRGKKKFGWDGAKKDDLSSCKWDFNSNDPFEEECAISEQRKITVKFQYMTPILFLLFILLNWSHFISVSYVDTTLKMSITVVWSNKLTITNS